MSETLSKVQKINFCLAMMDNNHGIVGSAYNTLIETGLIPSEIVKYVDAIDNRFYITEENVKHIENLISKLGERND